jgi:membrane protein
VLNFVISFLVVTLLFALILKVLPDAEIRWRDVWIGATLTSFLFSLGKFLLGVYLHYSNVTTGYGAAGSLVIVLLWVYYGAQILMFGAAFTRAWSERFGPGVKPAGNAVFLSCNDRAQQGIPTEQDLRAAQGR